MRRVIACLVLLMIASACVQATADALQREYKGYYTYGIDTAFFYMCDDENTMYVVDSTPAGFEDSLSAVPGRYSRIPWEAVHHTWYIEIVGIPERVEGVYKMRITNLITVTETLGKCPKMWPS